ncbi:MAG TPA: formate dehydrogenase accessory sulfurtransferase FdhD [Syntrophorhabdales bacterium]|nr:formate dehydrogenase accessory sulfurtransferase FdhD [Syntrophorhabdales bacterium]
MSTVNVPIVRFSNQQVSREDDLVVMEEPLEIYVDDEPYYVTMRLPGEELPLALGLCHSEGIIDSIDDTISVNYCQDIASNRINVYLAPSRKEAAAAKLKKKRSTAYSSCGICGKEIVDDIAVSLKPVAATISVEFAFLRQLQDVARESQQLFHATGGTHAAAIFDKAGGLLAFSEDVGRHNALDKAIGKVLFARKRDDAAICILSSRLSYEMVQKAARLGIEMIAGASAPTKLAIDLAKAINVTLIGFLRKERCNIYSCPERMAL